MDSPPFLLHVDGFFSEEDGDEHSQESKLAAGTLFLSPGAVSVSSSDSEGEPDELKEPERSSFCLVFSNLSISTKACRLV